MWSEECPHPNLYRDAEGNPSTHLGVRTGTLGVLKGCRVDPQNIPVAAVDAGSDRLVNELNWTESIELRMKNVEEKKVASVVTHKWT